MKITDISNEIAGMVSGMESHVFGVRSGRRRGSAFSPENGILVTTAHTLEDESSLRVVGHDEEEITVRVIGLERRLDLAVLEAESVQISPDPMEPDALSVGHLVFPLGRPGRSLRASFGMLSAVGPAWRLPHGGEISRYIETDGSLPRGFSGGPLVGGAGRIIGMNSSRPRGGGMTVPVPDIRAAIERIRTRGEYQTAYLGVNTIPVPVSPEIADGRTAGLMITEIEAGSPADSNGLMQGDIILSMAETAIGDVGDLMSALGSGIAEKEVPMSLLRSGARIDISVVPKAR